MNISDFERQVHNVFHNQEAQLDTNKFASELFARMDKKEKKYPFGWLFGLLTFGIFGLSGAYFYANTQIGNTTTKPTSVSNVTVLSNTTKEAEVKAETEVKVETEVKAEVKVETEVEKEVKVKVEKEVKVKVEKEVKVEHAVAVKNSNENKSQKTGGKSIAKNEILNSRLVDNENSIIKSPVVNSILFQLPELRRQDQNSLTSLYGFKPKRRNVECPTFQNKRKVLFFVQPEIGISSPIKSLEERSPDNSEITAIRKDKEESLEGLHAALYAGVHLGRSPFYVKTGFAYSRLAERMDLEYNTTSMDTTFGIISVTQSQSGDTLTVIYGNIITERTISGQKIKHYYHHLYDIPLCIGYQYPLTPRLLIGAELGLVFNVGLRTKGEILTTTTDFAPVNTSLYERSLGLGWRAGLDVEYALTGKFSMGLNTRFNGFTRSFSNERASYTQNYLVPGVFLYGKYYFRTLPIRH